jgi:hypothetical protein
MPTSCGSPDSGSQDIYSPANSRTLVVEYTTTLSLAAANENMVAFSIAYSPLFTYMREQGVGSRTPVVAVMLYAVIMSLAGQ